MSNISKLIKKLPNVRNFVNRINDLNDKINNLNTNNSVLEEYINYLADENWDLRRKIKIQNHEKIKVLFVCWRPAVWGSLKTVYEAMKSDDIFDVSIVTIPNKKQLPKLELNHEIYESEGAEEFWKGNDVISGYNYETGEWLDLRLLKPDYVCFQQPYNVCRSPYAKSWVVRKYAKLFYIHYASNFIGSGVLEESNPPDFIKDVSFYFNQNQMDYDLMHEYLRKKNNTFTKQYLTGFPRYDNLAQYNNCESTLWSLPRTKNTFRIIWTPRWCTNEGNCCFFDYKDLFLEYCKNNQNVDFIFRPHPQAFLNWVSTGELSGKDAESYKFNYDKLPNAKIDNTKEYLTTFYSSDCMVTDISSIVAEYFLTGKPIIYCHKKDCFNDFSRKLSEGFYWVRNWKELEETLKMLQGGKDPLKQKRESLIKEAFYFNKKSSGELIKNIIKDDFYDKLEITYE